MKTEIYNLKGEIAGEIDLQDEIFARPWNADLVHQALLAQVANRRQPLAHTKNRGEVSGGGRKPWRQKHTGRARHGSIRSPLWIGGGVSHGPRNERVFAKKINRKMRRAAIAAILSKRLADKEIKIVESLNLEAPKTKILLDNLKPFFAEKPNALLVPSPENKNIYKASRNVPKLKALDPKSLNVEDLLKYKQILIDKNALAHIK